MNKKVNNGEDRNLSQVLPFVTKEQSMSRNSGKVKKLNVVGDDAAAHKAFSSKKFSVHDLISLQAKTSPQEQFIKSFYNQIPVILQIGSAGTGKTMVAMYCALSEIFDNQTPYERLIIIRSAVQTRDIGFLKGSEEEKNESYEEPYENICDDIMNFKTNNYENLKSKNLIHFRNSSFLRGLTWDNAIIIADECQSMTYHELSTIMTRVGINSKIIFCGDIKQNDLHKKGDVSGLLQFMDVVDKMPSDMVDLVRYFPCDIVRSGIAKEFLLAEENEN